MVEKNSVLIFLKGNPAMKLDKNDPVFTPFLPYIHFKTAFFLAVVINFFTKTVLHVEHKCLNCAFLVKNMFLKCVSM